MAWAFFALTLIAGCTGGGQDTTASTEGALEASACLVAASQSASIGHDEAAKRTLCAGATTAAPFTECYQQASASASIGNNVDAKVRLCAGATSAAPFTECYQRTAVSSAPGHDVESKIRECAGSSAGSSAGPAGSTAACKTAAVKAVEQSRNAECGANTGVGFVDEVVPGKEYDIMCSLHVFGDPNLDRFTVTFPHGCASEPHVEQDFPPELGSGGGGVFVGPP
jgi:hypothetical protein